MDNRIPRPNVVLITTDQHRGDCLGSEGRAVKTPHLDDLARRGTRFDACITPNLVCQPSRASILTGLLPRTHGVCDNGIDLDPAIGENGFIAALGATGYATGFVGKAHFSSHLTFAATGTPECQHSQAGYLGDWNGPYMGIQHVELMVEGHNYWLPEKPPKGQHHSRWYYGDGRGEERNTLYAKDLGPPSGAPQTFNSGLPAAWHNSSWVADRTIEFIREHTEEPFFVWVSFPDPHHPFDCPEPWSRLHHPDDVDLPVHRERDFENRPWWHEASMDRTPVGEAHVQELRQNFSRIGPQPEKQLRALIANYFGMISLIDHQVGRIEAALASFDLADDTVIIFTADHGDWLGDHGLILKGPIAYEGLLRVPMILAGNGIPGDRLVRDPVSTLDLGATILDIAGAAPLAEGHGRSLRPFLGPDEASRTFAYSEWDVDASRCGVELRLRTVRTRHAKLTLEEGSGAGELYNLAEDPHEMRNLYDDPAAYSLRRELIDMLRERPDDARTERLPASGIA